MTDMSDQEWKDLVDEGQTRSCTADERVSLLLYGTLDEVGEDKTAEEQAYYDELTGSMKKSYDKFYEEQLTRGVGKPGAVLPYSHDELSSMSYDELTELAEHHQSMVAMWRAASWIVGVSLIAFVAYVIYLVITRGLD